MATYDAYASPPPSLAALLLSVLYMPLTFTSSMIIMCICVYGPPRSFVRFSLSIALEVRNSVICTVVFVYIMASFGGFIRSHSLSAGAKELCQCRDFDFGCGLFAGAWIFRQPQSTARAGARSVCGLVPPPPLPPPPPPPRAETRRAEDGPGAQGRAERGAVSATAAADDRERGLGQVRSTYSRAFGVRRAPPGGAATGASQKLRESGTDADACVLQDLCAARARAERERVDRPVQGPEQRSVSRPRFFACAAPSVVRLVVFAHISLGLTQRWRAPRRATGASRWRRFLLS